VTYTSVTRSVVRKRGPATKPRDGFSWSHGRGADDRASRHLDAPLGRDRLGAPAARERKHLRVPNAQGLLLGRDAWRRGRDHGPTSAGTA
jgi:hypothetical protein